MGNDSNEEESEKLRSRNLPDVSRRQFMQWSSLVMGWAAAAQTAQPINSAPNFAWSPESPPTGAGKATLLEDGGFHQQGRGWEMGVGCEIISAKGAPSPEVLHVNAHGSSTARATIHSPKSGKTYTVHGYMRTHEIEALEEGGGAVMRLGQYEFVGRKAADEQTFAKLTGTHDWTPFSYTFLCALPSEWRLETVWLELSLGLYRAQGEAWFADVTVVEGAEVAKVAEVIPREEQKGYPSPPRKSLANVAVWKDQVPVQGTASDPEFIVRTLQHAGYQVEFITSAQLADPQQITRERFDVLVLPYGASFPAPAQAALQTFLSQGGSFFATGGYTFNNPLLKGKNGWMTESEALAADPGTEVIREGNFEVNLAACTSAGWKISNPRTCLLDSTQAHEGRQSAQVKHGDENCSQTSTWEFEAPVHHERERFHFSCWAKSEVSGRYDGYAFIVVEQHQSSGKRVREAGTEIVRLRGGTGWTQYQRDIVIYPEAASIRISFGLRGVGSLWVDQVSLRKTLDEIRINTARGPGYDGILLAPEQIGVFDPDYRLRKVSYLATAPGQEVVTTPCHISAPVTGYAASGVLGPAKARWIPLLNAYDSYGRLRGAAGALMRHYNGLYRKSHWAFFGVEDRDLFSAHDPAARAFLLEIFDALQRKTFLHEVRTNYASYRQGENVEILSYVSNFGSRKRHLTLRILVLAADSEKQQFLHTQEIELDPDQTLPLRTNWPGGRFASPRYTVRVELFESAKRIDHVEAGFLVWDENILRGGFPLKYSDNYFRRNERTVFLQGSDEYVHTFINHYESAKTWHEDITKFKDQFLLVYEHILGARGLDDVPPEAWWREVDGIIQICQELKVIFFPVVIAYVNIAASERDLGHQLEHARAFARRYGLSPGLIYCLSGDLQCNNPDIPDVKALFNEYLKQRHGTDGRLAAAWHLSPPTAKIGDISPVVGTNTWEDIRTYDFYRFRTMLAHRWLEAQFEAVREIDPHHISTSEWYPMPIDGFDAIMSIGSLAPLNLGYFDIPVEDIYRFPQIMRYMDMRSRGKSLSVGEFGVKTHPAWTQAGGVQVARSAEEENQLILTVPHYVVGLGGSKVNNWCWKYPADFPFEWGSNYPCDLVSRDALMYFRNTALFFRQFDLKYEPPEMCFLIANDHRLGGQRVTVQEAQLNGIRYLLNLHCNFATIDDYSLESLPSTCKVLMYPLPFCPNDATFERVYQFVKDGGTLYVSGDISYDPERQRTRTDRLGKLLGVEFQSEIYPNISFEGRRQNIRPQAAFGRLNEYDGYPCVRVRPTTAEVIAQASDGTPVIFTNRVGSGRVFYSTDVLELHAPARSTEFGRMVYETFLEWAGVRRPSLDPDNPWIHLFRSVTREGDELFTLVNRDDSAPRRTVRFQTPAGPVRVDLARRMPGALAVTRSGAIQSIEAAGKVEGPTGAYCESTNHMMLMSLDQKDLKESEMLCLLPMGEGRIRINSHALAGAAGFQVGEFQKANWVPLERGEVAVKNGWLSLEVNPDRDLSIILIASASRMKEAAMRLTQLLTLAD